MASKFFCLRLFNSPSQMLIQPLSLFRMYSVYTFERRYVRSTKIQSQQSRTIDVVGSAAVGFKTGPLGAFLEWYPNPQPPFLSLLNFEEQSFSKRNSVLCIKESKSSGRSRVVQNGSYSFYRCFWDTGSAKGCCGTGTFSKSWLPVPDQFRFLDLLWPNFSSMCLKWDFVSSVPGTNTICQ